VNQDQINAFNTLAQSDYLEMDKARTDYDWMWDTLFFGRGYCETLRFNKKRTMAVAQRFLGGHAALKAADGTEEHNRTYCFKDGHAVEFGTFDGGQGQQGRRTDLIAVAAALKRGEKPKDVFIANLSTFIKYSAGMAAAAELVKQPPPVKRDIHITVIWGPTGVGKSHRVSMAFPDRFNAREGVGCWDTYEDEDVVFWDEFDYHDWKIKDMNAFLDCWRCPLKARYHNKTARWTRVVIAANSDPVNWYPAEPKEIREAFQRRLSAPMGIVYTVLARDEAVDFNW